MLDLVQTNRDKTRLGARLRDYVPSFTYTMRHLEIGNYATVAVGQLETRFTKNDIF
jgi:hypothetical protein